MIAAAGQIAATKTRVVSDQRAYDLADKALQAEVKKFEAGTSTTLNVLQQQQNLIVAESRLSSALGDQRKAAANYDRVIGTTLLKHQIVLTDK